ncbi:MAG: phosphoglycerate kinase [Chloroflexota bacterium]|nr:phosphoglycerate kinase [Chloroflexia bacterium]MDQ3226869.1 phosphoglycerate kinase [Chloroflexota bacterium]
MPKRSVADADVCGKRVLVRVDFNVPLRDGDIADDTRIRAALPTIRHLLDGGAAVVLVTHLGRPKGKPDAALSVAPVGRRLGELLTRPVTVAASVRGPKVTQAAADLTPGDILLLENTRFEPGEEANDPALAAELARLGDLFVNDAFGSAHRAHASTVGVAELLPAYAGLLLLREEATLSRLLHNPERPFVAVLGGAKVTDKLAVIAHLLDRVDALLLGGGMANTVLLAQGHEVGASLAEPNHIEAARKLVADAEQKGVMVLVPSDVVVASSLDSGAAEVTGVGDIAADRAIFDIGPASVTRFCARIAGAKTVFWNGPMGVFEHPSFAAGTLGIARCVADAAAFTVVGGGDSLAAIDAAGVVARIDHISTGGGASLEFLEGRELPGIAVLPDA